MGRFCSDRRVADNLRSEPDSLLLLPQRRGIGGPGRGQRPGRRSLSTDVHARPGRHPHDQRTRSILVSPRPPGGSSRRLSAALDDRLEMAEFKSGRGGIGPFLCLPPGDGRGLFLAVRDLRTDGRRRSSGSDSHPRSPLSGARRRDNRFRLFDCRRSCFLPRSAFKRSDIDGVACRHRLFDPCPQRPGKTARSDLVSGCFLSHHEI